VIAHIHELLKDETAGDPMTGVKWTHRTTAKVAQELTSLGIAVCARTVAKLLKQLDYRLRVNHKKRSSGSGPQRDEQFQYLNKLRASCQRRGIPIVSVDAKKRELVGNFKNAGAAWRREPIPVRDHDFPSQADGVAIPYGIYDQQANRGSVFVGTSFDTSQFAVDCIEKWWRYDGQRRYPGLDRLVILADGGGSNGPTRRLWKWSLQTKLCDRHDLVVTVSHFPPGASKWNPIDHRLFSEVSKNWAGQPLTDYETILNFLRTTKTTTGLEVKAYLVKKKYEKNVKVPEQELERLAIKPHQTFPKWNYTLLPRNAQLN
jgi:hypothetical protein